LLQVESVEVPPPGPGEVRLRQTACGLNYIDVYDRTGLYPAPFPLTLGREAAGVVESVGSGVRGFRPGDRVAYVLGAPGAYTSFRNVPANRLVPLPAGISDAIAATLMLKGLTAWYLLRRTFPVKRGHEVVVHAAAGGVGLLLVQWARALGAHVIGVVGSADKAALAREFGAHEVLLQGDGPLAPRVRAATGGAGAHVVYDGVGRDTFEASLDSLRPLGMMVTYGNASGPVPPFSPMELAKRGSLFLTRPSLFHYIAAPADLRRAARETFAAVTSGVLKVHVGQEYPLTSVAQAHTDLQARRTTGATVLLP
jgi:NADPH2:quinone reductase